MNATCKRLLSWLVVVTMVLSMVPVMDLSNFAVTTKAAENPAKDTLTAIEALRETFATAAATNATVSAICPVCGGEEAAEWTPLTGATAQLANPNGHYYLSGDVTFTAAGTSFSSNNNTFCLNLNGNDITAGGIALNISYGNVINVMDSAEKDGTVTGTAANFQGGAINVGNANARFNIYGGTFKKTGATGSVVCVRNNGGTVNMYGGTIDASDASNNACASTINVMSGANVTTTFNLYDGVVKCGTMTAGGLNYRANIMLGYGNNSGATFNMEGGTVVGGNYTGAAGGGGATFAVVMGSTLRISGGTVYGGTSNSSGANIFSINNGAGNLEISGGTIVGEVYTRNAVNVTLSGEPQIITSLELENGETVTATRGFDLSAAKTIDATGLTGGNIQVSGVGLGKVLPVTCTDAAEAAEYFSHVDATLDIGANGSNQLVVVEYVEPEEPVEEPEVGVFDPVACGGKAYCEACTDANGGEPVLIEEWTALTGNNLSALANPNGHYYLSSDISFTANGTSYTSNGNKLCLHLNDCSITAGGIALNITYGNTINVMGEGVVSGTSTDGGSTTNVNNKNGVLNIYGGAFQNTENGTGAVIGIGANGGTVNMYAGTIDAENATSAKWATAISIMGDKNGVDYPGVFNLYEGEIFCGTTSTNRGNIMVGYDTARANGATFNMMGGTVYGGTNTANSYGTFLVQYGGTLNVTGGTIYGGTAKGAGANIFLSGNADYTATLNVSDGEICGDVYANQYATVNLSDAAKIVKELTVYSETVTAEGTGLYVYEGVLVNIDGLTAEAEVYIAGKLDTALTTGTGVTSGIKAYKASQYTEAVEGVVYLRQAKAAVVTAEGENFYPTVEEAVANVGNGYIELHADGLTVTINGETYIDNRGYNVTVEGEGKLYAMDAANDDYVGYGSWTVNGPEVATDVINPVNGNRYIVILNDEGTAYSAHRVELYLTHISLRTSQAGLYYRAAYKADAALADRVMAYGIVFSAVDGEVHQGNFDKDVNIYSVMDGFKDNLVENTVDKGTSTAVFGIFKNDGTRTNSENVAAGEAKIHATPYINVDVDGDGIEDTDPYVIGNVQNDVYKANAGVVYAAKSLYDVLKAINDDWTNYESVQGQVQGFYDDWANYGMSEWATDLANIAG